MCIDNETGLVVNQNDRQPQGNLDGMQADTPAPKIREMFGLAVLAVAPIVTGYLHDMTILSVLMIAPIIAMIVIDVTFTK